MAGRSWICGNLLVGLTLSAGSALGQSETEEPDPWVFSISAYSFSVANDDDYLSSIVTADHDWLHLETRYNYEDLDTGSLWLGYNFDGGEELSFAFTPMIGGIFGHTLGIAPGYELSLEYWKVAFYSEGEYLFDLEDSTESFFYNWSELTISPADWLRVGLVVQRTQVYQTDLDTQHGLLLGVTLCNWDFAAYLFNLNDEDRVVAFSVELSL